ncbi:nudix domain-containing protein [Diplogelasinospora grovesii]|uniref:Nudix domain-containing protein n=1 Tax=Diplogelasinospora grovesii TaxID=303347 RepID=A0AAN6N626_9PEZI|nr:nudix domain-containing protein [Diplogelasinospora grovesii]
MMIPLSTCSSRLRSSTVSHLTRNTEAYLQPSPRLIILINNGRGIAASSRAITRRFISSSQISATSQTRQYNRSATGVLITMSQKRQNSTAAGGKQKEKKEVSPPRPSSSILLLSPTNQVLLLHRVQTSSSFASAHVFPGGNLSSFHEGSLSGDLHADSLQYRLAAVRETFEESGILLTRDPLNLSEQVREEGRTKVHSNKIKFTDWLTSVGGVPDTDGLVPFTRWITPTNMPKRFTTQMYLYLLPTNQYHAGSTGKQEVIVQTPSHDGGIEHTAATFDDVSSWLDKARKNEIILFPPQLYLLTLVSNFLGSAVSAKNDGDYQKQRDALLQFINTTPTTMIEGPLAGSGKVHPTGMIPWSEKTMSPTALFVRQSDKRIVLGLDKPGPELKDSGKGGDWDRVVLVNFTKQGPRDVEVRLREDVLKEEREVEKKEDGAAKL